MPGAGLIRPKHRQLPLTVSVQIRHGVFYIIRPGQLPNPVLFQCIDRKGLQLHADPPAHDDLHFPVAVHITVGHAVNGEAAALDHRHLPVAVSVSGKNINFQGLFSIALPEKGQRLLPAVPIQIHHLHRLDIAAGDRGGILRAALLNGG